jgi:hypothetical protein
MTRRGMALRRGLGALGLRFQGTRQNQRDKGKTERAERLHRNLTGVVERPRV